MDLTDNTHVLPKRRWSISGLREGPPAREPGKQHRLGKAKGEEGKSGDARRSGGPGAQYLLVPGFHLEPTQGTANKPRSVPPQSVQGPTTNFLLNLTEASKRCQL